jgi:hypothetical protein
MLYSNTFKGLKRVRLVGKHPEASRLWKDDIGKIFDVLPNGTININQHIEDEADYCALKSLSLMGDPQYWEAVYEQRLKLPEWW